MARKKQAQPQQEPAQKQSAFKRAIANARARAHTYIVARPHRSFLVTPSYKYRRGKPMASVWQLVKGSFATMWHEKKYTLVILVLFAALMFIVVGGVSQLIFLDVRKAAENVFSGNWSGVGSVWTLFAAAVTGALNPSVSAVQSVLGIIIIFMFWLALVWILRRRLAGEKTSLRDAFYNSGGPIVPTLGVAFAVAFQLIPGALGVIGAALTLTGAWFNGGVESMLLCSAGLLLCLLSLYWLAGSLMALVIVTLPGMYPWRALSAASDLVIGQRWKLLLRLGALCFVIFLSWAVVLIPALLLEQWLRFDWLPIVPIAVQFLYGFTLVYATTFIYKTYKSMLP